MNGHEATTIFQRNTGRAPADCGAPRPRRSRISRGQSMVEFALISIVALVVMLVGIQFAIIGQAALAVSEGSSALARYAANNPGAFTKTSGGVTTPVYNGTGLSVPAAAQSLLASSICDNSCGNLTLNIASYSGTSTSTPPAPTNAPVANVDQVVITLNYNAANRIVVPSTLLGISFPSMLTASDSQIYE
jgi:Flp pilus assembly protein TadG